MPAEFGRVLVFFTAFWAVHSHPPPQGQVLQLKPVDQPSTRMLCSFVFTIRLGFQDQSLTTTCCAM